MKEKIKRTSRVLANSLYQKCKEGVSYNPKFENPQWGYMVVIKAGPVFKKPQDVNVLKVAAFIEKNLYSTTHHHPLHFFGVWTDKETGKIHFDLSEQCAREEFALELAQLEGQIAIWDVENKKEIRLPGTKKEFAISWVEAELHRRWKTVKASSLEEAIKMVTDDNNDAEDDEFLHSIECSDFKLKDY